jgi:biofilm PGA synthesis protein PgaA
MSLALLGTGPLLGASAFGELLPRGASLGLAGAQEPDPALDERDRAVRLAREGRYEEALVILHRLYTAAPGDLPLRADFVAVLAWSGHDEEAMELGEHLPFRDLEPFVSEALARSARNIGRPGFARLLYADVLERDPSRVESHIGYILSALEGGDLPAAEAHLEHTLDRFPEHAEVLLAGGHVRRAAGRHSEAALLLRKAGDLGADPAEARRLEVLSLVEAGAVFHAVDRMRASPTVFDASERGSVLGARASRGVQWSVAAPPSPDPALRFDAVDRAIARLDSALVVVDAADGFAHRQLRLDRIVAFRERVRMQDVLDEVHALEAEGVEIPPYVQRMAGDAHLHLRNPKAAESRYRVALAGWPGHPESQLGLFYALLEQERHVEAREVISLLAADQPERRTAEGLREELPNPDRLTAEIALRLGRAFAGDLDGAQRAFEELAGRAPMNLDIRQELASVYLWRGWPYRALDEYARILALDPFHVGARVGRASAQLDLGDRPAARATLDTVVVLAAGNQHVQRTAERFRIHGLWEFSVEARGGRSTGGDLGTRDDMLATRLSTPPIGDRLRLFVGSRRSSAAYPDQRGGHDRVTAGAELSTRGLRLTAAASADRDGSERPGGAMQVDLRPGDRWSFGLRGASYADEVPLQATRQLIDGWSVGAGVGLRASERRWWSADASLLEMSDGNRRWSGYSAFEQEVLRRPLGRLSGLVELYGARNSRDDAPYFNPSNTLSTSLTAQWEWVLWRSYESGLTQRVRATGGHLIQSGFDDRLLYSAEYGHEWNLSDRISLDYGLHWGRPVFDGLRERRTSAHANLTWRLPR